MQTPDPDQHEACRELRSRQRLLDAGASRLPRAPWLHHSQPPYSVDLVRFALWRSQVDKVSDEEMVAALTLLPAVRAEMEQLETALSSPHARKASPGGGSRGRWDWVRPKLPCNGSTG